MMEQMPFGAWPKEKKYKRAGRIVAETITSGFEAYALAAVSMSLMGIRLVI